jgi:prophage regulatory protein
MSPGSQQWPTKDDTMTFHPMLPETGSLRFKQVPLVIPASKLAWWDGVHSGPQMRSLDERISAWRAEHIRALIEAIASKAAV